MSAYGGKPDANGAENNPLNRSRNGLLDLPVPRQEPPMTAEVIPFPIKRRSSGLSSFEINNIFVLVSDLMRRGISCGALRAQTDNGSMYVEILDRDGAREAEWLALKESDKYLLVSPGRRPPLVCSRDFDDLTDGLRTLAR